MKKHLIIAATAFALVSASTAYAESPKPPGVANDASPAGAATPVSLKDVPEFKPTPEQAKAHEARKAWFRDARFGMFIHWGPYAATPMGQASSPRGLSMTDEEYEKLADKFNPVEFKPDEWVSLAKAAGMKYIVLTAMHADGFCMWPSQYEPYNISATPYKKDIVKEFADACRRQDMPFGLYYSVLNWRHPMSPIIGRKYVDKTSGQRLFSSPMGGSPGNAKLIDIPNPATDMLGYGTHCGAQITELIKNYGPLTTLWADMGGLGIAKPEGKKLVDLTRSLQPDILVNNRFNAPGDYVTPEGEVGRFENVKLWESCQCMGGCWSHMPNDANKTTRRCIHLLLDCAGAGGNLLLDVGPDELGRIDAPQVEILRQVGGWMKQHGESIYGTIGGPFKPWMFGVATRKDKTVYLHIRHWIGDSFRLPPLPAKITKASVLTGGEVAWTQDDKGLSFRMDAKSRHPWDTVIALELDRPAAEIPPIEAGEGFVPMPLVPVAKSLVDAKGHAAALPAARPGYKVNRIELGTQDGRRSLELDMGAPRTVSAVFLTEADGSSGHRIRAFEVQYEADGAWKTCATGTSPEGTQILNFPPVTARKFRLRVTATVGDKRPWIEKFDLFASN